MKCGNFVSVEILQVDSEALRKVMPWVCVNFGRKVIAPINVGARIDMLANLGHESLRIQADLFEKHYEKLLGRENARPIVNSFQVVALEQPGFIVPCHVALASICPFLMKIVVESEVDVLGIANLYPKVVACNAPEYV